MAGTCDEYTDAVMRACAAGSAALPAVASAASTCSAKSLPCDFSQAIQASERDIGPCASPPSPW